MKEYFIQYRNWLIKEAYLTLCFHFNSFLKKKNTVPEQAPTSDKTSTGLAKTNYR